MMIGGNGPNETRRGWRTGAATAVARFRDRHDAGVQLAATLREFELERPLVLGIPRGGVVIAAAIADALGAELDVVLSRKLRAPLQPELAVGSVDEDGGVHLNAYTRDVPGITDDYIERERDHQISEIERRRRMIREIKPRAEAAGRSVIVADDGIATGSTMFAALETVRARQPRELIAALPVAPAEPLRRLDAICDAVICLQQPARFAAVSQVYDAFGEVTDEDVARLLRAHAAQG